MTRIDITVAVTAHSESVVAGPTMRSAETAIRAAEAEGFRVERLIGLDAPSDGFRSFSINRHSRTRRSKSISSVSRIGHAMQ